MSEMDDDSQAIRVTDDPSVVGSESNQKERGDNSHDLAPSGQLSKIEVKQVDEELEVSSPKQALEIENDDALAKRVMRKVSFRVIPLLALAEGVAFVQKVKLSRLSIRLRCLLLYNIISQWFTFILPANKDIHPRLYSLILHHTNPNSIT